MIPFGFHKYQLLTINHGSVVSRKKSPMDDTQKKRMNFTIEQKTTLCFVDNLKNTDKSKCYIKITNPGYRNRQDSNNI